MIDPADHLYERVLVLRCQFRDEAAFAEMIERYQTRLRFYICKMLNDSHIAEDVLQEVWWDMFRGISRLKQPGAFRVWLYRIARDRTVRELRRRRIAFSLPADLELIDSSADLDRETELSENWELVREVLDSLPLAYRDILVLRYIEDMPYEEIAAISGCPVGTVRSRLHFARRALRAKFERIANHD
jgi:RNA polymerase sigma-70 factor (ECF subfamily)